MESPDNFCLTWNEFESNINVAFRELREEKDFFDVTLACDDDNQIQAHKVILSACSPFFRNVLRRNPHQHPLLYLKGVKYEELLSVLNFMYMGEVNVAKEELHSFLTVAEDLKVKGLTQNKQITAQSKISQPPQDKPELVHRQPDSYPSSTPPPPVPKHSHVVPSTPTVMKKSLPAQSYSEVDDEMQKCIQVKTEPIDPQDQQTSYQPISALFQTQDDYQTQDQEMVQEEEHDQGTVALDEGYDYRNLMKDEEGRWICPECNLTTRSRTNIKEHIDAKHLPGNSYLCPLCSKACKSTGALRVHKSRYHKNEQQMI